MSPRAVRRQAKRRVSAFGPRLEIDGLSALLDLLQARDIYAEGSGATTPKSACCFARASSWGPSMNGSLQPGRTRWTTTTGLSPPNLGAGGHVFHSQKRQVVSTRHRWS